MTPRARTFLFSLVALSASLTVIYLLAGLLGVLIIVGTAFAISVPLLVLWGVCTWKDAVRERAQRRARRTVRAQCTDMTTEIPVITDAPGGMGRTPDTPRPTGFPASLSGRHRRGGAAPSSAA